MAQRRALQLQISPDLPKITQRRIAYAFCSFCAIYGYGAVLEDTPKTTSESPRLCYGVAATCDRDVVLPAFYLPRPPNVPLHSPVRIPLEPTPLLSKMSLSSVPCFHASASGNNVDWLGEIFEWLSCADEYAVAQRDEIGRIPFAASIHGRFDLDPSIPYAAVAMYQLNQRIRNAVGSTWPEQPIPRNKPDYVLIASSHDLDYLPVATSANAKRVLKNIAIAALLFRDPALVASIIASTVRGMAKLRSPLDCIEEVVNRQVDSGIQSTYNVICRNAHVRDSNYQLANPKVQRTLQFLADRSMEIGLHGSYTSLEDHGLEHELEQLAEAGYRAVGVRQHWLRFAGDTLFERIAKLGLAYDSTVGFSDRVGFRAGACFPYAPYDFRLERSYPFVEIPLVIMDVALYEQARRTHKLARDLCMRVLDMVESFGWGGVAILWHNTAFGGGQMPPSIGQLYWDLKRPAHKWVSCQEVAKVVAPMLLSPSAGNAAC